MSNFLSRLNKQLADEFGEFHIGVPNWRVVWSNDQFEKRITEYTNEGFRLLHKEVREVPKYRQWNKDRYVLERALPVPSFVETDLVTLYSYEPVWTFEDRFGRFLYPKYEACKFIIETINSNVAKRFGVKYKDPENDFEVSKELKLKRIQELESLLFGNETEIGDALAYREGVFIDGSQSMIQEGEKNV